MDEKLPSNLRVLVVEDDPASAKLLAVVLRLEGCEVRTAPSAELGRLALNSFQPHLAIVDLVLPQMSGLMFINELSANPLTRGVAVIAVSVLNGPALEAMALEAGSLAYLRKPIDPTVLVQTVVRVTKEKT
jgi:DNA-binding response OmpR family regulator